MSNLKIVCHTNPWRGSMTDNLLKMIVTGAAELLPPYLSGLVATGLAQPNAWAELACIHPGSGKRQAYATIALGDCEPANRRLIIENAVPRTDGQHDRVIVVGGRINSVGLAGLGATLMQALTFRRDTRIEGQAGTYKWTVRVV